MLLLACFHDSMVKGSGIDKGRLNPHYTNAQTLHLEKQHDCE